MYKRRKKETMSEEIIVNIDPEGGFSIDAKGFKGKTCTEVTKFLSDLGSVKNTNLKPEYRQADKSVQQKNYLRGG